VTPGAAPSGFSPVEDSFLKDRPRVLRETRAEYPPEARNLGLGGVVLLRVSVDKRGHVHAVRIVQGVGHGMDEAARTAMLGFEFSPARLPNGNPVDHVITYRFRFDLPY
jgi:protein TonB